MPQSPDSLNCRIPSALTDGGLTSCCCHQYNANVNSLHSFEQHSFITPEDWSETLRSTTKGVDVLIPVKSSPPSVLPIWSQIIKIILKTNKRFCWLAKFQINRAVGKEPRFRSLHGERGYRSLKMSRAIKHQHSWHSQLQCFGRLCTEATDWTFLEASTTLCTNSMRETLLSHLQGTQGSTQGSSLYPLDDWGCRLYNTCQKLSIYIAALKHKGLRSFSHCSCLKRVDK